ncbi:sigma-54-dependent Fis family transcriptional regulator [bacterium]|nr:sigma-54-dependent Fis family transcriptional regulator [bacterium]
MSDDLKILLFDKNDELPVSAVKCRMQQEFLSKLREDEFDLAIVVNDDSGNLKMMNFLRVIGHRAPLLPIIFLVGNNENDEKIDKLVDLKFFRTISILELKNQIGKLYKRRKILTENGLIGRSESLQAIADTIMRVAPTDISILITGESGTGKELVAKSIHNHSKWKDGPFVAINCGAIPETLLESQLFGYKRGAFTGANKDTSGFFDRAKGGTLFLDEIGEIQPSVQVKFLRVLETSEYFPLGGIKSKRADSRIITATNRDLKLLMQNGKFREDLYYRIGGVQIFIPPLRERKEDIPILAFFFAEQVAREHNLKFADFSDDAIDAMLNYHWPGNVRELRNLVENAVILSDGNVIRGDDLIQYFSEHNQVGRKLPVLSFEHSNNIDMVLNSILVLIQQNNQILHTILNKLNAQQGEGSFYAEDTSVEPPSFYDAEEDAIERALKITGGSRRETAKILGISVRTLYRKMKRFGIK